MSHGLGHFPLSGAPLSADVVPGPVSVPFNNKQYTQPSQVMRAFTPAAIVANLLLTLITQTQHERVGNRAPVFPAYQFNRSSSQGTPLVMLAQPVGRNAYDPLPTRSPPQFSWTQNLLQSTLGVAPSPFTNKDWPLPRVASRAIGEGQGIPEPIFATAGAQPFSNYDWPLPRIPGQPTLAWTQNLLQSTLSFNPAPFLNYDWQLPRTPVRAIGEGQSIPLAIFQNIQGQPFTNYNRLPVTSPIIDRTWTQNLLQTTLGFTPSPFTNYDWPLPQTPARQLFSWSTNLIETTLSQPIGAPTPPPRIDPVRTTYGSAQGIPAVLLAQASTPFNNNQVQLPVAARSSPYLNWSTNLLETTLKSRQVTWTPSGGITISGHALVIRQAHWLPSGGIHISGQANIVEVPAGGTSNQDGITAPGFKTNIGLNKTKNWG